MIYIVGAIIGIIVISVQVFVISFLMYKKTGDYNSSTQELWKKFDK